MLSTLYVVAESSARFASIGGVKPIVPIVAERWEWEGSEVSVYIHWSDKGWFDIEDGLNIHDALYVNSIILSIELF